ncbi:ABC transporter permease [Agromyces larvae]|uniref:ABC transporter permease n=1 Tax=Agromyces larvae TaxID=2929802 RepID=A0ABY4BWY2_9MICO|nr:ABC transporter permease [Agromyces larvae]UOE43715.1 ABC transporter permease [Agromyces larvae]
MADDLAAQLIPTIAGVVLLAAIATAALWWFRVRARWAPAIAILRAAVQLAAVSLILTGIISSPGWITVALGVMVAVAMAVATGRIGWSVPHAVTIGGSIAAGVAVAGVAVFATGALEFSTRYVLALGAIVIGNAMSIATLTGRRFVGAVGERWGEVEAWLSLGATPRQSTRALARDAVREALVPTVDQTRTTGLVVLPGAFVGAIFAGISPVEAGRFQLIVLASILAAGAITGVLVAVGLGPVRTRPGAGGADGRRAT